jgi:mycothiol synthase
MGRAAYHIRNYRDADFDQYVDLISETEKVGRSGRCISRKVLDEQMRRPRFHPGQDMFVAEQGGKIVGFISLTAEPVTQRVLVDWLIHPEHRLRGPAIQLLEHATRRARELKVKLMHISVNQDNNQAQTLLSKLDFRVVRCFLEMALELDRIVGKNKAKGDLSLRPMQPGEEEILTQLQNRAFAGQWGYNPNTVAEMDYSLRVCGGSAKDVVLVFYGEKPAGYCWTKLDCEPAPGSARKGYIFMIGADPAHRGKGIGRLALMAGLSQLKSEGVQTVELTVDSQNNVACRLYHSVGFRVLTSNLYYEKRLDRPA